MEDKRPNAVWIVAALLLLVLLLSLYVLSIGPVARAHAHDLQPAWVKIIYFPLIWITEHSDFAGGWLRWYIDLWMPEPEEDIRDLIRRAN